MATRTSRSKQEREAGRFAANPNAPQCPFGVHRGSLVQANGHRTRKDGTSVFRYRCSFNGARHFFSICPTEDPQPTFTPQKCLNHPGSTVWRNGKGKPGTGRQRYMCRPTGGGETHQFVLVLPREHVEADRNWRNADAVKNPHRGKTAAARYHTATTELVAEGLQMLGRGMSYADVGKWAAQERPARTDNTGTRKPLEDRPKKNFWQTGADWVEMFSPVLWDAWQSELAGEQRGDLPRILIIDDLPFYAGPSRSDSGRTLMAFSVLVATEKYQPSGSTSYSTRARLIRAYPDHTAEAYELFLTSCGFLPDVVVSDLSSAITTAVKRLRKVKPEIVWVPSAYHVQKRLTLVLDRMTKRNMSKTKGSAVLRLEGLKDRIGASLQSPAKWRAWWRDFDRLMDAAAVPGNARPIAWRKLYFKPVEEALEYIAAHPLTTRGTGGNEATINGDVKPFFHTRAASFTNIERLNRAADLLTLSINGKMDSRRQLVATLQADVERAGGFAPSARAVTDALGYRSLRDKDVLAATLAAERQRLADTMRRGASA